MNKMFAVVALSAVVLAPLAMTAQQKPATTSVLGLAKVDAVFAQSSTTPEPTPDTTVDPTTGVVCNVELLNPIPWKC